MIIDPSVIRQVSREKDIDAEKMFGALEEAMSSAARKYYHDKAMVTAIRAFGVSGRQCGGGGGGGMVSARRLARVLVLQNGVVQRTLIPSLEVTVK